MAITELHGAWADWIECWPWEWWCSLTFRHPATPHYARKIWRLFHHSIERYVKGKVHYALVMELQHHRSGVPHLHALMLGVRGGNPKVWERWWERRAGLARVENYDSAKGAALYLTKEVQSDSLDITFSKGLEKVPPAIHTAFTKSEK